MGTLFLTPVFLHESVNGISFIRSLMKDLQNRSISPGHLYHTPVQSALWHKVHLVHSPLRKSRVSGALELEKFARDIIPLISGKKIDLTSFGCGDGYKDARIIKVWQKTLESVSYQPVDISTELVKMAYEKCRKLPAVNVLPGICANLSDPRLMSGLLHSPENKSVKIGLYLGINPNFNQTQFFNLIKKSLQQFDAIIFSVNLAPGKDYRQGVQKIFPQYDNPETRIWLSEFLSLVGVRIKKKALTFSIRKHQHPFVHYGICVDYLFPEDTSLDLYGKNFSFRKGELLNLFNSFRHTLETVENFSRLARLRILHRQISSNNQEALFFVQKKSE